MRDDNKSDTLPIIAGLTETAQSDPGLKLSSLLAGRYPQPTRDRLASTISDLESLFGDENDDKTRLRIGAALQMLRGGRKTTERE